MSDSVKKFKGNDRGGVYIYYHPGTFEGKAIVHKPGGYYFNGIRFDTLDDAKTYALKENYKLLSENNE